MSTNWVLVQCPICGNRFYIKPRWCPGTTIEFAIAKCARCNAYRKIEVLESTRASFFRRFKKSFFSYLTNIAIGTLAIVGVILAIILISLGYQVDEYKIVIFSLIVASIGSYIIFESIREIISAW